jgi:hypothetical protein
MYTVPNLLLTQCSVAGIAVTSHALREPHYDISKSNDVGMELVTEEGRIDNKNEQLQCGSAMLLGTIEDQK